MFLEAEAACSAGLQAVIVDRSIEQEGGIELDEEVRKNFAIIDNLNELFGEDEEDDEEFAQVERIYWPVLMNPFPPFTALVFCSLRSERRNFLKFLLLLQAHMFVNSIIYIRNSQNFYSSCIMQYLPW